MQLGAKFPAIVVDPVNWVDDTELDVMVVRQAVVTSADIAEDGGGATTTSSSTEKSYQEKEKEAHARGRRLRRHWVTLWNEFVRYDEWLREWLARSQGLAFDRDGKLVTKEAPTDSVDRTELMRLLGAKEAVIAGDFTEAVVADKNKTRKLSAVHDSLAFRTLTRYKALNAEIEAVVRRLQPGQAFDTARLSFLSQMLVSVFNEHVTGIKGDQMSIQRPYFAALTKTLDRLPSEARKRDVIRLAYRFERAYHLLWTQDPSITVAERDRANQCLGELLAQLALDAGARDRAVIDGRTAELDQFVVRHVAVLTPGKQKQKEPAKSVDKAKEKKKKDKAKEKEKKKKKDKTKEKKKKRARVKSPPPVLDTVAPPSPPTVVEEARPRFYIAGLNTDPSYLASPAPRVLPQEPVAQSLLQFKQALSRLGHGLRLERKEAPVYGEEVLVATHAFSTDEIITFWDGSLYQNDDPAYPVPERHYRFIGNVFVDGVPDVLEGGAGYAQPDINKPLFLSQSEVITQMAQPDAFIATYAVPFNCVIVRVSLIDAWNLVTRQIEDQALWLSITLLVTVAVRDIAAGEELVYAEMDMSRWLHYWGAHHTAVLPIVDIPPQPSVFDIVDVEEMVTEWFDNGPRRQLLLDRIRRLDEEMATGTTQARRDILAHMKQAYSTEAAQLK